jgi:hypothetical protein
MSVDGRLPHRAFVISKGNSGRRDIRAEGMFGQMGNSGRRDIQEDGMFRQTMGRERRIELMTDHRAQNIA